MTPSIESVDVPQASADKNSQGRASKRRKLSAVDVTHIEASLSEHIQSESREAHTADSGVPYEAQDDRDPEGVPAHSLGIKPLGNAYDVGAPANIRTCAGVFAKLPDELLLHVLEYLRPGGLLKLSGTCRALHAFCAAEELWKTLAVEYGDNSSTFSWRGTWRTSFLRSAISRELGSIKCDGLFSDALYRPFFCAHTPLEQFMNNIPAKNQIKRLTDLDSEAFNQNWANEPFILTDPVKQWSIYKQWSIDYLEQTYGDIIFRAEAVTWPLSTYAAYMRDCHDETPMYLFDRRFVEKMNLIVNTASVEQGPSAVEKQDAMPDYDPPSCFHPDYFSVLGPHRPDHRWLILGPARSGSTFHKDPNGTSAWNAVIRGTKYWIMFPSTICSNGKYGTKELPPPPGVYPSADGAHITTPFSIPEWLLNYHEAARATPGCMEGICHEGEVLHVPSGWYHLVLNLDPAVAVTQNFVPRAHLGNVMDFLSEKKEQVSGFADDVTDPHGLFLNGLGREFPGLLAEVERSRESCRSAQGKERTKWEEITSGEKDVGEDLGGSFSFGFGGYDFED